MITNQNTRKCPYCNRMFITDEFMAHDCIKNRNPVKQITISFFYETDSENGDKTIHAYGFDGSIYLLTKPNPTKLNALKAASDETKQEDYRDWLRRRPNSTRI